MAGSENVSGFGQADEVIPIRSAYLVIDLGTGSLRASLFTPRKGIVGQARKSVEIGPRVDAERIWQELSDLARELLIQHPDYQISCAGISSLLGWVAVDEEGLPTADAWTWMHQQPDVFERLRSDLSPNVYERIGRRFNAELGALKWMALKDSHPEAYHRTKCFLSIKDYLNAKLTGTFSMDYTHAGYTGVFSVRDLDWDESLLGQFGLDKEKMPRLFYASERMGFVSKQANEQTGLPAGIPVVCGGPDGSMAILGGGGVNPGDAVDVMGTTDVFFAVNDRLMTDSGKSLVNNPHLLPGLWLTGGPMGMTGGTVKWFAEQWSDENGQVPYGQLESLASDIHAGCSGLLFIPSLTGERAPLWNPSMRGTLAGIQPEHNKGHMFRALLEGNAYSLRQLFERLKESGCHFDCYVSLGGGANSLLSLKIRASITKRNIKVPRILEASSLGAAILCGLVAGDFADPQDAVNQLVQIEQVIEPDGHWAKIYEKTFTEYINFKQAIASFYMKSIQ